MPVLIRPAGPTELVELPAGVTTRAPSVADTVPLGRLYFASYEPGAAAATEAEAIEDITLTFESAYGNLNLDLSRLACLDDVLIAAILVVDRAPWPDTPDCPFIIELFTSPTHRHQGIARALLASVPGQVALRVAEGNHSAKTLYTTTNFHPWP
ncbi:GNAT family N-acetyltransferase [Kribbella kalugense]|uniref:Acetyltransferase (GNAT) family protein n=1 Tax=Kribbella kalugense TaxID=2512221 RepID=A0A4V3G8N6_9ACTN|nr:GNAT family N-acetyltransferase [Kribbella kalugense]TDW23634.1 acetyltransferase (GNAT) family protein [Kribbella kalugense]